MKYRALLLDKIAFCSDACLRSALAYPEDNKPKRVQVSEAVAAVIHCYGCGLSLVDCFTTVRAEVGR